MNSNKNTTTLITAYAVNPYKGSEDGTGWNMIMETAKHQKVIAITRENNQAAIDRYFAENDVTHKNNIQFEYFDLPYYLRFWKKKSRGALLYFYLWQIGMIFFIRSRKFKFDITHHLNFHSDWMPSFLWVFGKPFVWGPIGHHPKIPRQFILKSEGRKAYLLDRVKWLAKKCFWTFDPFLKMTKWKASKILCINSSVEKVFALPKEKVVLLPAIATEAPRELPRTTDDFQVLSIGRFVSLKGFDLTIQVFAKTYHQLAPNFRQKMKLILIGKGPMKTALQEKCKRLNISTAVTFIEWIPRKDLDQYFSNASLFLFPSHEGAGMVVPEALAFGLPVICLDNIGPGESIDANCGIKITADNPEQAVNKLSKTLLRLCQNQAELKRLSEGARDRFENQFTWKRKGEVIANIYKNLTLKASEQTRVETTST